MSTRHQHRLTQRPSPQETNILRNQKGLTLIEILIGLSILAFSFYFVTGLIGDDRAALEETVSDLERTIRFAENESVLRNRLVRMKFSFTGETATYTVEFGTSASMLIPKYRDPRDIDLLEKEQVEKENQAFQAGFSEVPEFKGSTREINPNISIVGVGSNFIKSLKAEGEVSIYFYPNGLKDASVIYVASYNELVRLEIEAARSRTYQEYQEINSEMADLNEGYVFNQAKDDYEKWARNAF